MASEFPVTDVITSNITRETLFPSRDGFGVPIIIGNESVIDHGERVRFYSDPTAAAVDFASTDESLIALNTAFAQSPRPTLVGIAVALAASAAGFIKGGAVGTFAAFNAISDGEFAVSIDGDPQEISGLNFTLDADLDDVAARIETALQAIATGGYTAATCEIVDGRMVITSGTITDVVPLTTIATPAGTDISGTVYCNCRLNVTTVIVSHTYVDFTGELNQIKIRNDDWFFLALSRDLQAEANQLAAAAWAESNKKMFAAFDDSLIAKDPVSVLDLPYKIEALGYNNTFTAWNHDGETYPEVSEVARLATVDYTVPNSAITLKFKSLPGIAAIDNVTPSERIALLDKKAEIYVTRGGVNMLEEGVVASGEYIDVIHAVAWMEAEIAYQVYGVLFASATKVPMTDAGVGQIESAVRGVLDTAVAAGIIAEDEDEDGNLIAAYTITPGAVLDLPPSQRAQRIAPAVVWSGRLSGAIHFSTISGTVTV